MPIKCTCSVFGLYKKLLPTCDEGSCHFQLLPDASSHDSPIPFLICCFKTTFRAGTQNKRVVKLVSKIRIHWLLRTYGIFLSQVHEQGCFSKDNFSKFQILNCVLYGCFSLIRSLVQLTELFMT